MLVISYFLFDLQARRWQVFYGTIFELMTGRQADLIAQVSSITSNTYIDCEWRLTGYALWLHLALKPV